MRGEQHSVVVTSMANSGDGVGRILDKVVFIPFAAPGDELLIEITEAKKSFCKAKILKVIKKSEDRIAADCKYFGECGGCDWQHLPYEKQLLWKKENLIQTFKRIGQLSDFSSLKDIEPSPKEFHYRNRIQLQKKGKSLYYSKKGSHEKVAIDHCPIAEMDINQFISNPENWNSLKTGKYEFAVQQEGKVGIYPVDQKGLSKLGFRQVNTLQNQALASRVVEIVQKFKIKEVVDLFCGQGNWGIELTERLPELFCTGIDSNPINIKKAQKNTHHRLNFLLGDVVEHYPKVAKKESLVLVDPPRAGLPSAFFELLSANPVPYMIYISCHPASQARDIKTLREQNWNLLSIEPFDMFPQTSHLESLILLQSDTLSKTANC